MPCSEESENKQKGEAGQMSLINKRGKLARCH
jgi:hypothetical protein